MNSATNRSLRWLLVSRLAALQAVMLVVLVLTVVAALWAGGYLISLEPDDETIDALRGAIARDANGGIEVRETPELSRRRASMSSLWFVIRDRNGHAVSQGEVPDVYAKIGNALDGVGQARLGWNLGDPPRPTARMRWVHTASGDFQILIGSGGPVSWHRVALAVALLSVSVLLPIVVAMILATLVATPIVVRRSLQGLGKVAAQAGQIEIGKRGTRLPLDQVPTEIAPLVSAVNNALRRLDDGYERHQRFLADAAHELRTPIAILQTRIDSLALGPSAVRLQEDVSRLSNLADQLLDLERLKHHATSRTEIDLVDLARRLTADLAPLAIAAGYEIAFEHTVARAVLPGDEGALERALANLIQNAIEHGGRSGRIVVRVGSPSSISVADDGQGVPAGDRERVFEPFYRGHNRGRGAGLGLNLVREIVRLHDGHVEIHDGPAGGACVTMSFGER